MSTPQRETVVLIHGLWLSGWSLALQARRLRRLGYEVRVFSWPTVRRNFRDNAEALEKFLRAIDAPTIHLVGQSLGGVLIRALFHYFPAQRPGRIVTWGAPHQGSLAAVGLARSAFGRWMLGASIAELLAGEPARWQPPVRVIGTLNGDFSCGLGAVIAPLPRPHDGVVTAAESCFTAAADARTLQVSHLGMLFAPAIIRQTDHFLRHGQFERGKRQFSAKNG
ncbi:MAG: alpha/beta hydrolase [Gammaproteobacteria bacterium]|nr:alpha/beta hydrolase [Gammaproteobacteria bacterium]